ncbi:MAG TPA: TetR family transcriptional regulator [Propionibacteriaceae bacterium]|nr:TetR family transcriptional regulator [Propionibacteriaceae bacterium]
MVNQREPRVGRRPGNQDTRGQIITAARHAFAAKGFAGASMRAIAAEAGVDAALIHHYFENKQQLFLATVALPLDMPQKLENIAVGDRDGMGERLVRTVLGVWDSDLQPSLVAAVRTTLTDPALTKSVGEFLALEIIGHLLHRDDLPAEEANRRAGLAASQILGLVMGRYVLQLPFLVGRRTEDLVIEVGPTVQRYLDGRI